MVEPHKSIGSTGSNSNEYKQNGGTVEDDHPKENISKEHPNPHVLHPEEDHVEENQPPLPHLEFTFTDLSAKPRLKWSSPLHERFIQAITDLGGAFRNGTSSTKESPSDAASSSMPESMPKQKNPSRAHNIHLASEYQRAIYREKQIKYRTQRKLRKQQEMVKAYLGSLLQTTDKHSSDEIRSHLKDMLPMLSYQTNVCTSSLIPANFDPPSCQNTMLPIELEHNPTDLPTGDCPSALSKPVLNGLEAQPVNLLSEHSVLMNVNFDESWLLPDLPIGLEGVKESSSQMNENASYQEIMDYVPFQDIINPASLAANQLDLQPQENMVFPPHFKPQVVSYCQTEDATKTGAMESETNVHMDDHVQKGFLLYGVSGPQQDDHNTSLAGEAHDTRDDLQHEQIDSEIFYNNWVASGGIDVVTAYLQENM
ncbi:hypothetical protein Dimus_019613 [Dionaea muscipula]